MKSLLTFVLITIGAYVCIGAFAPAFSNNTFGYLGPIRINAALILAGFFAMLLNKSG